MIREMDVFMGALEEICEEKGLNKKVIIETVEAAIAAAYRKDYGKPKQIIKAVMNMVTGDFDIFREYEVLDNEKEIKETEQQLTLDEAKEIDKKAVVGGVVLIPLEKHDDFGRIAAQTAKQVIIQRIREAERELLFTEFNDKENIVINATVQQLEGKNVILTLGKANGIMYPADRVRDERYYIGQRIKVYVKEVSESVRGPQILVSRSDKELIRGLFESEVPEIAAGTVEIKSIAREGGSRTKLAVISNDPKIDPVGSCVGQRGLS